MVFPVQLISNHLALQAAYAVVGEFEAFRPAGFSTGSETWFDGAGTMVVPEASAWRTVWDRHIQNESIGNARIGNLNPPPEVDFTKNVVVAIFAGTMRNTVGFQVAQSFRLGSEATVSLAPVTTNTSGAVVAVPRPWAFLVLPRSKGKTTLRLATPDGWRPLFVVPPTL